MDRDEVAVLLAVLVCVVLLWGAGGLTQATPTLDERTAWRRLWLPAIPASVAMFTLCGWAAADPEGPQRLATTRLLAMTPCLFVGARAIVRAVQALWVQGDGPAVVTGLIRPRINVSAELSDSLDASELAAVMAHEEAHVRHRDPLRIWLAQIVTDLQWPVPRARMRQRSWLRSLELARDEEATVRGGADPAALASAIVKAARWTTTRGVAAASLSDDDAFLATRIERLLGTRKPELHRARSDSRLLPLVCCLAAACFGFGMLGADPLVAMLAGSP